MKIIIKDSKKKNKRKNYFVLVAYMPWVHSTFYQAFSGDRIMIVLPDDKKLRLLPIWKTRKQNIAKVDPTVPLIWESMNPDAVTFQTDTDGFVKAFGGNLNGADQIIVQCAVTADANLDEQPEAYKQVKQFFEIMLVAGEAFSAEVQAGQLEDQVL